MHDNDIAADLHGIMCLLLGGNIRLLNVDDVNEVIQQRTASSALSCFNRHHEFIAICYFDDQCFLPSSYESPYKFPLPSSLQLHQLSMVSTVLPLRAPSRKSLGHCYIRASCVETVVVVIRQKSVQCILLELISTLPMPSDKEALQKLSFNWGCGC